MNAPMVHLRLVRPLPPLLTIAQLSHFERPRTWPEILGLDASLTKFRWRRGVMNAEEYGLLTWIRGDKPRYGRHARPEANRFKGAWVLTAKGFDYVSRGRSAA